MDHAVHPGRTKHGIALAVIAVLRQRSLKNYLQDMHGHGTSACFGQNRWSGFVLVPFLADGAHAVARRHSG